MICFQYLLVFIEVKASKMQVHNLWPIPIYESVEPVQSNWLNYIIQETSYERMKIDNGDVSIDRYLCESLPDLKNAILKHCHAFTRNHLAVSENAEFYMQNSWAVKHLPGDEAQSHTHTGSLISGVYYLHTPKDSGNITFSKEYCYTNMFPQSVNFAYDEFNLVNCEKCTIEVENGKILLFPSHLLHSVEKNNTSEDRYSLAFNFYVRGKFGEKESVLEIK